MHRALVLPIWVSLWAWGTACSSNSDNNGGDENCDPGYELRGTICADIDECTDGTHTCDDNATCLDTQGSYDCICNPGFTGNGVSCSDIDECTRGTHTCNNEHVICINTQGSYACACARGYSGDGTTCTDIDECADGTDTCDDAHGLCTNWDGGFTCNCVAGYTGDGTTCSDIDECAADLDDCDPTHGICTNNEGSFHCVCEDGYFDEFYDGTSCVESTGIVGHAVLIGHDYYESNADQKRIIGNAVLQLTNREGEVRVLAYTEHADNTPFGEVVNTNAAINIRASELGRTWRYDTFSDSAVLSTELPGHDVLLVYEQESLSATTARAIGTAWASTLDAFVSSGGVVVVCDFDHGSRPTWEILNSSRLMEISEATIITDETANVVAPTDLIADDVATTYTAEYGSVGYVTSEIGVVVESAAGHPVVIHRAFNVRPGSSVLIGHDYYTSNVDQDTIVGNAVLQLAQTESVVRVLAYTQYADTSATGEVANTNAAIDARATVLGRSWSNDVLTDYAALADNLDGHHVLLVYEQESASQSTLQSIGSAWASTLNDFVNEGGVVVVCDWGGSSSTTWEILNRSGLMDISGATNINGDTVSVVDPGHAIATDVSASYIAENGSVSYSTTETGVVVESSSGAPVVLYRSHGAIGGSVE